MAYRWNDAGTQAIAEPGGEVVDLSFVDVDGVAQNAHYLVPSQLQCEQCHSESGAVAPIGPKARLLNTDQAYDGGTENQLAHWSRLGILSGAPDPASAPKLPARRGPRCRDRRAAGAGVPRGELRLLPQPHRQRAGQRALPATPR